MNGFKVNNSNLKNNYNNYHGIYLFICTFLLIMPFLVKA